MTTAKKAADLQLVIDKYLPGWYRGWPYVEHALTEARKVFAERGI